MSMLTKKMLVTLSAENYAKFRPMSNFDEANFLYHMASKGGNVLEVGTGPGRSALLMAKAMKDFGVEGQIYTIGWLIDGPEKRAVPRLFAQFPELSANIHHSTQKSEEIFGNYPDGAFDFVYIDGDHSYEGVVKDIQNYKSKVKPGGVMAFHDTDKAEVQRAIDQYLNWTLVAEVSRIKGYSAC